MAIEQGELLSDFLVESKENLDHLDEELLVLEANPSDREILNAIFRRVHTIKGVCGFLDLVKLESVTHAGETLLQALRSGERHVDDSIITLLLTLCDAIRTILGTIESQQTEGDTDYNTLASQLLAAAQSENAPAPQMSIEDEFEAILAAQQSAQNTTTAKTETPEKPAPDPRKAASPTPAEPPLQTQATDTHDTDGAITDSGGKGQIQDSSLRVDVKILDHLMNLAGELVLARNQILQATKNVQDTAFHAITQRLNLVTSELQEGVMKTRMQPINTVWSKFPRVVRDLARSCRKQVRLEMFGKETELDKTLIEAIKDPLTHIVRNSIDHGLEAPEKRTACGKNPEGSIVLKAFHEGGYVIVEITDDGAGLNTEKIKNRAVEKGLISRERAAAMGNAEINRLIFAAGFSTADTVTNLSGRGVGMDVVKSSVEGIGGQVDIASSPGQGSTIRLKIPLTLAIIPALLLTSGRQRFAVPQSAITELVRLDTSAKDGPLSWIGDLPFFKLRGDLLPILFLAEHLGTDTLSSSGNSSEKVIVILDVDNHRFGVVVDAVHDTEEIVVKPLGQQLKSIPTYAGATILGDGQIALILDPVILAREARVDKQSESVIATIAGVGAGEPLSSGNDQYLIIQVSASERAAVPLDKVSRLEKFAVEDIEHVGSGSVIKYRGGILRLVNLASLLERPADSWSSGHVVVIGGGDSAVGVQVTDILDVSSEVSAVRPSQGEPGVSAYGVVQGRVIALLDVNFLLQPPQRQKQAKSEGAYAL
jgi:two-component system chemotaxis sensor kinase CheA